MRTFATIAAIVSLVGGLGGLLAPGTLADAFGVALDSAGTELVRLACVSYLGYGVLNWAARNVTDGAAWRAIAAGNAAGWGFSGLVGAWAIVSGVADSHALLLVALQVAFAVAWITTPRWAAPNT